KLATKQLAHPKNDRPNKQPAGKGKYPWLYYTATHRWELFDPAQLRGAPPDRLNFATKSYYPCVVPTFLRRQAPIIALASFPGSGNTWMRYLLEQSTGVLTGSVYNDGSLVSIGFLGENVMNPTVLVHKTHELYRPGRPLAEWVDGVVVLMRNPFHAIVAEFNRKTHGHTGVAPDATFAGERWREHVEASTTYWENFVDFWLGQPTPTHVVWFEDVRVDARRELGAVLDFLKVRVNATLLDCLLRHPEGRGRRRGSETRDRMRYFSDDQRQTIWNAIRRSHDRLRKFSASFYPSLRDAP
ncbi:WSCD family member GA21586-like, partial [Oscarella lobularis]|uniref:WSCD family member GA21586-like n=1 Tax=Oscarella lobularis TaxID=121494 RepID=UPI0033134A1C